MFDDTSVKAVRSTVRSSQRGSRGRMTVRTLRQSLTSLMQEPRRIFGRIYHLELANIERIHLRKISAPVLLNPLRQVLQFWRIQPLTQYHASERLARGSSIHFR